MTTYFGKLHNIYATCEPRQGIGSSVVKVQVPNQKLVPSLPEKGVETGAGDAPREALPEWPKESYGLLGERYIAGPSGQVFRLVWNPSHACIDYHAVWAQGEDFARAHAGAQADEKRERDLARLSAWTLGGPEAKMPEDALDLFRRYYTHSRGIVARRPEPDEGILPNPLPLISSHCEDVAEEVDVALYRAFRDYVETGVPPLSEIETTYSRKLSRPKFCEVAQKCADALGFKSTAFLGGADLIPVPLKSFTERLTGYRPTVHGQNLGLLRSAPEGGGSLCLEGARLANSVPLDLGSPAAAVLPNVGHVREV